MSLIITDARPQAALVLADGEVFLGRGFGASGSVTAEVVFNTAMTGYQEIVTDPSYTGQIVTLTYPHIGNVGVNAQDEESAAVCAAGLIIRSESPVVSNFRSEQSLSDYLRAAGVVGLCDIDTRKLTRILRTKGAQAGTIVVAANGTLTPEEIESAARSAAQWGSMVGRDLASEVTCKAPYEFKEGTWTLTANDGTPGFKKLQNPTYKVVAYDFGVKRNILRLMVDRGIELTVVPARTPVEEVLAMNPDGVFLSNGPGDPQQCGATIANIRKAIALGKPIFGICLGNQLLSIAAGATTFKLKYGHRSHNQPALMVGTDRAVITSQNHGFAVDTTTLDEGWEPYFVNLNDGTSEGIRHRTKPFFSVQFHPEASGGPVDTEFLFDDFIQNIEKCRK